MRRIHYGLRFLIIVLIAVPGFCQGSQPGILLHADFNGRNDLQNWEIFSLPRDSGSYNTWQWSSYGGYNSGGVQITSTGDGTGNYECGSIEKGFLSLPISIREMPKLFSSFLLHMDGSPQAFGKLVYVVADAETGKSLYEIPFDFGLEAGIWYKFNFQFSINPVKYPSLRVGFRYYSPTNSYCGDTFSIDEMVLKTDNPPQTTITKPAQMLSEVRKGTTVKFEGMGTDPDGDELEYWWRFCAQGDDCKVMGKKQEYTFNEEGVFEVICWARDSLNNDDPTPDRRSIRVVDNVKPEILSEQVTDQNGDNVEFFDQYSMISAGSTLFFQMSAADSDSPGDLQYHWKLFPGEQVISYTQEVSFEFDEPGFFVVGVIVLDSEGGKGYRIWKIRVLESNQNIPPMARIVSPAPNARILLGASFDICGEVIDPDTPFDSCQGPEAEEGTPTKSANDGSVFWTMNNGSFLEGIGASGVSINREGRYQLSMLADDGEFVDRKEIHFSVVDSQHLALPIILYPTQSVRVQPGQRVYFEGTVPGGSISEKYFEWKIEKTGSGGSSETIRQSNLGSYVFVQPGHYEVTLSAVHPQNESLRRESAKREIWVEDIPEITGNTSIGTAAELPTGFYRDDAVDGVRFFKVTLRNRGQNLRLHLEYEGTAKLTVFNNKQEDLGSQQFTGSTSFQLRGLSVGTYIIQFDPLNTANSKQAKELSFGMGVDVTNAGLYFPDVVVDTKYDTNLGLVNSHTTEVNAELLAYDKNGGLLEQMPVRLNAMGRISSSIQDAFPLSYQSVAWVRVDSDGPLSGYSLTRSYDGLESYAMHAAEKLASELYVPHIAQKTGQWYTMARVINGSPETTTASVVAGVESRSLKNNRKFSKDDFNMVEKFGGTLPTSEWGSFIEESRQIRLAGVEIFGKLDGNRQTAGLMLDDNGQDNPNFTYIRNDIYFTHIARSVDQFWTGIALVNTADRATAFKLLAYGDGGAKVGEKDFQLGAGEKLVDIAENILQGVGSPANIDWIKIQADQGIVGYELFGTHDNRRLAGLEGITGLKKEICFPHLDNTRLNWFGVSVVNASEATCNLVFKLMSDSGQVLMETQRNLNGNEKLVTLVTDLFDLQALPANAGWVACTGDQLLAGFELFGDFTGNTMAAVIAR